MALNSAPLIRGLSVAGIGVLLTLSHIMFAAASAPASRLASDAHAERAIDIDHTSSISAEEPHAENCYGERQVVKSIRGKSMVLHISECD
jgi:hypothetical protein